MLHRFSLLRRPGFLVCTLLILVLTIGSVRSLAQITIVSIDLSGNIRCTSKDTPGHAAFPDPEWTPARSYSTAYVEGSSITATITVRNNTFWPYSNRLTLSAAYYVFSYPGDIVYLSANPSNVDLMIAPYGTQTFTVTFNGMPYEVDWGCVWITYGLQSGTPPTPTSHVIYQVVASPPQAPMGTPWVEVLHDACSWAAGAMFGFEAAEYLTTDLFASGRFTYTGNPQWVTNPPYNTTFRLTAFLNATGQKNGNCVDVSDYLTICANALGLNLKVARYRDSGGDFQTNYVCYIGNNASYDWNYFRRTWGQHQIARAGGGSGNVYDATVAFYNDLSGAVYKLPPYDWPWPTYWQYGSYGLVHLPSPSTFVLIDPPGVYSPGVE